MNNTTDILNQWLQELSNTSSTALSLDEKHRCFISTSNNIDILVCGDPLCENFTLVFHICDLAAPVELTILQKLLALNLNPALTRGGAIGYDQDKQILLLTFSHEYQGVTAHEFVNMLENFSRTVGSLQQHIKTLLDDSEEAGVQPQQTPLNLVRI